MSDPRAPLHPQVKLLFDMLSAGAAERVLEPEPMRVGAAALEPLLNAGAPEVGVDRELQIPGPLGPIRARVFAADSTPGRATVVYFHGGGYVFMNPATHARLCKQIAVGVNAVVVSVDYRLAPEHPYPAPVDDCAGAFRWVREHASELGGDPARIAVAGDSAGGNAAVAVCLRLRDAGERAPNAVALLCPWTDMSLSSPSMLRFGPGDPVLDTDLMTFFRDAYVKPDERSDPGASVLEAELRDLPPTLVVVGGIDPLLDDGVQFTQRLAAAGGDAALERYDGMPHDFMLFPGLDDAQRCVERVCTFLKNGLAT